MKIKELIRKLKDYDENVEIVFTDGSHIFNSEIELYRANLILQDDPVMTSFVKSEKDSKGDFLVFDTEGSDFYTDKDFK